MSNFSLYKSRILELTKGCPINLQVVKDKANIQTISTETDCLAILKILEKPKKVNPKTPQWVLERYNEAHRLWFQQQNKQAYKDGYYCKPLFPKIYTSNGLTNFAINFITWLGFRATRISASGRKVGDTWIRGTTRPGSADISATIRGRSVMIEIKVGMDKPSERQIKEQDRERRAGGVYEFCRNAEDVINLVDSLAYG